MSVKYRVLLSIGFGFILTIISFVAAFSTDSPNPDLIIKVIAWNFQLAGFLYRLLPTCADCGLSGLFEGFFLAFIIGQIIYSIFIFCFISLINQLKNKKQLS